MRAAVAPRHTAGMELPAAIPLGPEDRAILALESDTIAGHTCKVLRVGGPVGAGELRARIAARIAATPLLTRRLGGDAAAPAWVPDRGFDVARHVSALAPPTGAPLSRDETLDLVAALFAERLPRERPLWKLDLVPLADGGTLLVWRIHHALADGTTALRFARALLWDDGAAAGGATCGAGSRPPGPGAGTGAVGGGRSDGGAAARQLADHAADEARRRAHLAAYLRREFARSHARSPFDGAIGRRREIGFAAVSLPALHDAAKQLDGATVNDAVLTVVAGGLRQWLEQRHGPLGELRVRVPVSLHHGDDDAGNRDSFFALGLPLGEPDPVARLRVVHARTRVRKADHDAELREQLLDELAHRSPHLRELATRLERSPRRFALSVSNVVGPRRPVELMRLPVRTLHSLAEIGERHALRVAVTSFEQRLCFGLLADPELVPEVRAIAAAIEREAALLSAPLSP